MKSSYYFDVLRGRSQELPDVRSKVVRVFVSSTFTDTLAERDSLIENIFPKLKDYCKQQYGLEFQYADMRWGIQTESANNHGEVATCLKEIELCKKYSVATNFVVLLSHRYGSRPIPAQIRASLFELFKQTVISEENGIQDGDLLAQWYKIDTNCIPHAYILQNISSILPGFISKNTDEIKQADKQWRNINNQLRTCLRRAAKLCHQRKQISESDYDEFFISITEKEIVNGILLAKNANERSLCFLREIVDIREHLSDDKVPKYIDMSEPSTIDEEAEKLLERLKNVRIPAVLKSSNIYKYKVPWSPDGITRQRHAEYIQKFNNDFYKAMKEQIDRCVQARLKIASDDLQHEVLEHAIQCKTYVSKFHGRSDVLSKLEKYVKETKEYRPCVVYGDSGCGKTSVLAKTATEVFKWLPNRSVSVILRFLGTTPASSSIYKTLLSISEQICEIYNTSMHSYSTVNQLRDQLELNLLSQIPDNEYLLILLDSIDQLQTDAYDCKWLPIQFPSNVKCIVSTLPEHGRIYKNLQDILQMDENIFIHVPPFEPSTVAVVYNDWLTTKHRSLSDEQRLFIQNFMETRSEILPLFMKLVFDIISTWHSYDEIDERLNDLKDVDDCIRYLFQHLQIIHHPVLFSRALCYMTACRSGISQNELEDVLSLDDDVLKSVFQHYIPPVRRLPGILWTRIRNDLDEYITEKEVDDAPVIYWYHRRFIEVAKELYIKNLSVDDRRNVLQNVVDLFKETWKGKNKPFKIDDPKLVHKYKLDQSDGEIQANRFTTSQPIEFVGADGQIQYNKRKLNELPQFLSQLAPDISAPIAAEEILFNYSFMHAKFRCSPFVDVVHDISLFENQSSYKTSKEIEEIQKELSYLPPTYLLFGLLLNEYPDNYAFELTARLVTLYGLNPWITELIKQCDEESPRHCALIVPYCQVQPPGNGLIYSMNKHTMPVVDLDFVNSEAAAISLSNKIVVINMRDGNTVIDINLPIIDEPYLNSTTVSNVIMISNEENALEEDADDLITPDADNDEYFKKFMFIVNSTHHVYLVSNHGDVKFHQTSSRGYLTVELINRAMGLCLLVTEGSNSLECWHIGQNKLFTKLDLKTKSTIKQVVCSQLPSRVIIIALHDGTILFYIFYDSTLTHRATIDAGQHLDTITVNQSQLICTFDSTIPIDFVLIDMEQIFETSESLTDEKIMKTAVAFNPPITSKPYRKIILPENTSNTTDSSMKLFFMIITKESLYIIHVCKGREISYLCIPEQCDIASICTQHPHFVYTARRGIINIYKWRCIAEEDNHAHDKINIHHVYQLFVTIDVSASSVLSINPSQDSVGLFLCSLQNGAINAYHSFAAHNASKNIPPFPRTTEVIDSIQLSGTYAITIDILKQELTLWLYQHSTAIESRRLYSSTITINDYTVLSNTAILVITNTNSAEIYALKSLNKDPFLRLQLSHPSRVFPIDDNTFVLLSSNGSLQYIHENKQKFNQTSTKQLNIKCTKLFGSILTFNSQQTFVVLADDQLSLAICSMDKIIYMNIDFKQHCSSLVSRMISDYSQDYVIFYFENKSLITCRIEFSSKPSYKLTSFGHVDLYDAKKNCLSTIIHDHNQLQIHNLHSGTSHESIQLENTCEQLCVNECGDYVFVVIRPRLLFMYRVKDRRQLARLFAYDHITRIVANKDFIVLAMNDRRLLTLLIADPDDPELQSKIQALPTRKLKRDSHSAAKKLVQQMDAFKEMSSDDYDSDIEDDNDKNDNGVNICAKRKVDQPITSYRFLYRLKCKFSSSKMKTNQFNRLTFAKDTESTAVIDDSDIETNGNNDVITETSLSIVDSPVKSEEVKHNLEDIHEKTIQHDQQQIKGVQLANANTTNPKIINGYSVTSNTCSIQ